MNRKIIVGPGGPTVTLTDRNYVAAGGEATVYKKDALAYRIYHDPANMIPVNKIQELMGASSPNVNKPIALIYDPTSGKPIGFTIPFLDNTHPLCKLFTSTFKQANAITPQMTADLVKAMQVTVAEIHRDGFLVVDLNEMNVLVDAGFTIPYFIDTGGWQTPSFPATALMESVRDPLVKNNKFTEGSDWFSWSILAFQLYVHVHPFKGKHPKYKPAEWRKRMDDGASIFDKGAMLPSACNPLSVIPKRHLDWFKAVYTKNERSSPPLPDSSVPILVPRQAVTLQSSGRFKITEAHNYGCDVIDVYYLYGVEYAITSKGIFINRADNPAHQIVKSNSRSKYLVCETDVASMPVRGVECQGLMVFGCGNDTLGVASTIGSFYRNGAIYTVFNGFLTENTFSRMGQKMIHRTQVVENVSDLTTKVYDGMIIQDLFGKIWISVPYAKGRCSSKHISELDGFRIIDAKGVKNYCIVIGEKKGIYHRFIIIFGDAFQAYTVRQVQDINYDGINFTVNDKGVGVLLASDDSLELFIDNKRITVIPDPPFDAKMKLFNTPNGVHFINGTSIFKVAVN